MKIACGVSTSDINFQHATCRAYFSPDLEPD